MKSKNNVRLSESQSKQMTKEENGNISNEEFWNAVRFSTDNLPKYEESPYIVCYCEWNGDQFPSVEVYKDSMAETEEEKRSDAWSLCEQAQYPTISWLWNPENEEIVEMFSSHHFQSV